MAAKNRDKLRQMAEKNDILFRDRACPQCGSRLAVCLKPQGTDAFPYLNLGDPQAETAYYCPICRTYHSTDGTFSPYAQPPSSPFAGDGKRYPFTRAFVRDRVSRVLFIQGIGALCVLPLLIHMLRATLQDFSLFNWAGTLFCAMALFVLLYFFSYYFRLLGVCRRSFFELGEKGVIFCDGIASHYMPWEDFRLAEAIPGQDGTEESYIFDTATRSFVLNQNLENHKEAALRIARRLRDTDVPMNPRLLHLVY